MSIPDGVPHKVPNRLVLAVLPNDEARIGYLLAIIERQSDIIESYGRTISTQQQIIDRANGKQPRARSLSATAAASSSPVGERVGGDDA